MIRKDKTTTFDNGVVFKNVSRPTKEIFLFIKSEKDDYGTDNMHNSLTTTLQH